MLDFLTQYAHSWETLCEALAANEQTLCFHAGFAPRAPAQVAPPTPASVLSVARLLEAFVDTRRTGHERPQPAAFEDHNGVVVAAPPSESANMAVAGGISSSLSNPNWNPPGAQAESAASSFLHPTVSPAASANPAPKTATGPGTVTATTNAPAKGAQANVPNSNSLYNLLVQPEPPPTTVAQALSNSSKFSAILQLYNKSSATQSKAPSSVSPGAGAGAGVESKSSAASESSSLSTKTLATWPSVPDEAALAGAKETSPSGRSASIDKHPIMLLAAQNTGPPTVSASAAPVSQQQPPSSSSLSSFLRFSSVSDLFRGATHANAQQPAAAANAEQLQQQQQQQQRVVEQQQLQPAQQQTSDENTAASQASRGSGHFEKHEPEKNKRREGTRSLSKSTRMYGSTIVRLCIFAHIGFSGFGGSSRMKAEKLKQQKVVKEILIAVPTTPAPQRPFAGDYT